MKRLGIWMVTILLLIGCGLGKQKDTSIAEESELDIPDLVQGADANILTEDTIQRSLRDYGPEMEKARELAVMILNKAAVHSDPREAEVLKKIAVVLDSVRLNIPPPGRDLKLCKREKNVLAFVMGMIPNTIHICSRTASQRGTKRLAQVLIHEGSHVIGVTDECLATRIEVTAMRSSGKELSFKNGYWKRCQMK